MAASPSSDQPRRRRRHAGVRDRVVELVRIRAGDLAPNPANWRRHPEGQRAALRGLLGEIGYADALLATRDGDRLVLVDGHLRQSLDPDQVVPVLVLDLSESEAALLLASLDPLAGLARPEPAALAELLQRVSTASAAVQELLDGLARGAGLPVRPLLGDPEDAPPLPRSPRTRPGDVWLLGEHRLLCADARRKEAMARLMDTERAEVCFTDPPYGVSYVGRTPRALTIEGDDAPGLGDLLARSFTAIDGVLAPGARIYVCHPAGPSSVSFAAQFLARGWRWHQSLVWVKDALVLGHADYHYRHEPIIYGYAPGPGRSGRGAAGWYGGHAESSVLEVPRPKASREHPTAKPVELIRRCLANSSAVGDLVLDPFAGSGSTLVAAEVAGRRARAMEIDPGYCDVIIARWERLTGEVATREPRRRNASDRARPERR